MFSKEQKATKSEFKRNRINVFLKKFLCTTNNIVDLFSYQSSSISKDQTLLLWPFKSATCRLLWLLVRDKIGIMGRFFSKENLRSLYLILWPFIFSPLMTAMNLLCLSRCPSFIFIFIIVLLLSLCLSLFCLTYFIYL